MYTNMQFEEFLGLMDTLLGESGCPWDRTQTFESMRQYLLEECYEVIEAINNKDMDSLREELGDVFLQVIFHSKLAEKAGEFDINDVIAGVSNKLISRHTHVFGEDKAASADEVVKVWEANKAKEQTKTTRQLMDDVPRALPALTRAAKVISRSQVELPPADSGAEGLTKTICESLKNMRTVSDTVMLNEEFGKIMFQMVKLADILDINAEFSLTNAVEAFINTDSPE